MSELAEEIVTEWLNREGFFTIRGRREGNTELDVLAIRWRPTDPECWHYEVQVSLNPIAYISKYGRADQKRLDVPANSARKRSRDELRKLVGEWVLKKYRNPIVLRVRQGLCALDWQEGFVHGNVKDQEELRLIESHGIRLINFRTIVGGLLAAGKTKRQGASGSNLAELLAFIPSRDAETPIATSRRTH